MPGSCMDKSTWTAPQWQAHIERLPTAAQRRHAVENEVPEEMRERVKSHLVTVWQLKTVASKKKGR